MIVLFVENSKLGIIKNKLERNEYISKQTIKIRDAKSIGMNRDGTYIIIEGEEGIEEKVKEVVEDNAVIIKGEEMKDVITAIKDQEKKADAGFGALFG